MNEQKWQVIENTPGYMPDSPDPVVFDDRGDALSHAYTLANELRAEGYAVHTEGADPLTLRGTRDDGDRVIQVVPVLDDVNEVDPVAKAADDFADSFDVDDLIQTADDLGIGAMILVDRIADEVKARISGTA